MTLAKWKWVDRYDLLSAIRRVCATSGGHLLVVVGDDDAHRGVAADLVEDFMRDLGIDPVRVLQDAGRASVVKQSLANAWRQVDDQTEALEIPRSVGRARYMAGTDLVHEISSCCAGSGQVGRPFIFDTVDPNSGVPRFEMSLFGQLAEQTQSAVVVFSRAESGSAIPRTAEVLELADMPVWEVRNSLLTSSAFEDLDPSDLQRLAASVATLAPPGGDSVNPMDAYDVLEAEMRRIASS